MRGLERDLESKNDKPKGRKIMKNVNQQLKDIFSKFTREFQKAQENSRIEELKTMRPGSVVPDSGKIFGDNARAAFKDTCEELRGKVQEVIGMERERVKKEITEAPSVEAVNSISLLNMREDVPKEEIDNLIERYGSNYQAYQALSSIAKKNGHFWIGDHPLGKRLRDMDELEANICREIDILKAESGHASPAFESVVGMTIDNVFPADE